MTKTVSELADDIWRIRLGLVDINKSPTAAQAARVERLYNQKYAEMQLQDRGYWPQTEIPDAIVGAMSRIIAAEIAAGSGRPVPTEADDDGQVVSIGTKGLRMLQRLLARDPTGLPTTATYF